MGNSNSFNRSKSRGTEARGMTGLNGNGKDAYKKSLQSTKGHYRVAFTRSFSQVTEKDVELRKKYAIDLISEEIAVPADIITLRAKRDSGEQTITARDEVFYVKVGTTNCGKISIRTQRHWKGTILMFIFQTKGAPLREKKKGFTRNVGYKKRSKSQVQASKRKAYNNRKGGTN